MTDLDKAIEEIRAFDGNFNAIPSSTAKHPGLVKAFCIAMLRKHIKEHPTCVSCKRYRDAGHSHGWCLLGDGNVYKNEVHSTFYCKYHTALTTEEK